MSEKKAFIFGSRWGNDAQKSFWQKNIDKKIVFSAKQMNIIEGSYIILKDGGEFKKIGIAKSNSQNASIAELNIFSNVEEAGEYNVGYYDNVMYVEIAEWLNPNDTKILRDLVYNNYSLQQLYDIDNKVENKKLFNEFLKVNNLEELDLTSSNNHENDLLNKCQELLESNYNLILTGAPGTGKTYLAKQIAAKMIFDEDKNIDKMNDDEKAKFEYQYKFVQFHPSYDYTDFVEGIRPVTKNDDTYGFKRKDGTFKEFCQRAVYFATIISYLKEFCIEIEDIVKNGQQYITYDREDKEQEAKINQITIEDDHVSIYFTVNKNITILFDEFPNMYIRFCQTPINNMVEDMNYISGKNSHHTYYYGFLKTFYGKYNDKIKIPNSCNNENKPMPFVFVIDEINRGDINKILGELFYAIDLGYRGEKGKVETQYQNLVESGDIFENGFYIPENVYIIGTMNDIDRSVESMDFAIRRRFVWQEVKPEDTADEILKNVKIDSAASVLNDFNKMIADKDALGEMYQIGASYFLKLDTYFKAAVNKNEDKEICIKEAYQKLWDNHLNSLIYEYVRGKKSGNEIFDKIKNKYFDLTGINCKENQEDAAE